MARIPKEETFCVLATEGQKGLRAVLSLGDCSGHRVQAPRGVSPPSWLHNSLSDSPESTRYDGERSPVAVRKMSLWFAETQDLAG